MNIFGMPYRDIAPSYVIGFISEKQILKNNIQKKLSENEKKYNYFNNLANGAGYLLSPLVGLVRLVVNSYFLFKGTNERGEPLTDSSKTYLKLQIFRGSLELFGGGYLLWIPDLIMTFVRWITDGSDEVSMYLPERVDQHLANNGNLHWARNPTKEELLKSDYDTLRKNYLASIDEEI